jgi:hypothetical protein
LTFARPHSAGIKYVTHDLSRRAQFFSITWQKSRKVGTSCLPHCLWELSVDSSLDMLFPTGTFMLSHFLKSLKNLLDSTISILYPSHSAALSALRSFHLHCTACVVASIPFPSVALLSIRIPSAIAAHFSGEEFHQSLHNESICRIHY